MRSVFTAILSLALVASCPVIAQSMSAPEPIEAPPESAGPSGNTHPEERLVDTDAQLPNPFGEVSTRPAHTPEEKRAFAEAVDLSPLRGLAVGHNGRVKIIDSLARETVNTISGTRSLHLPLPGEDGEIEKASFDPVFTLIDIMIDPAFYVERPLVYVNYLPLREAYLDRGFPDDATQQLRWKKLTRVSPAMIARYTDDIFAAHSGEEPYRAGIQRIERRVNVFLYAPTTLHLVAPDSADAPWLHVAELAEDDPIRVAFAELGEAWRSADAEQVNALVADLASTLPTVNAELYPEARREIEIVYNRANAFEWGAWAYMFSLLALVLAFGTGRRWLAVTGNVFLVLGVGLHAAGFAARCFLAERFAIQNQFESMTGLSLFAALVGLVIMMWRKQLIFGAAAAACGFLILLTATQTGIPGRSIEREAAILNTSVLLKYHVTTVLTSYGLITLGFVVSMFYLVTHYAAVLGTRTDAQLAAAGAVSSGGTGGGTAGGPTNARILADLDAAQMIMLQLAFWTLGVGILLGAWWADHSWGRWWAFDPKETWALITWIVYLIAIHVRFGGVKDKGLTTAWLSVAGFVVMLFTYFGVNLLLPGLHAYA